ncbi:MAG: RNA polymerase sigma-54 factor [Bacteroidetes bacterium]|nr:MAG: RNA polymerase sigma-54 factor [Bacteroidota bacterium]|tara:strand:- start:759 stop:2183 length:1425 start_codon:yes stop_codon:yes gene_type:complete
MKQYLKLKLSQKLSPQQIQLMKLIQLPTLDFEQKIQREIEENPALEEGKNSKDEDQQDSQEDYSEDDINIDDYINYDDTPSYKLNSNNSGRQEDKNIPFSSGISFTQHLLSQLKPISLNEKKMKIAEFLVGSIDESGYIRLEIEEIIDDLAFTQNLIVHEDELKEILNIVQDFDPPGVGALSLQECLIIQLRRKKRNEYIDLAIDIIENSFEQFSKKHFEKLMSKYSIEEQQLKEIINLISKLNPKPGGSYSGGGKPIEQVIPDFRISIENDELTLDLNYRNSPVLNISRDYDEMLRGYKLEKNKSKSQKEAIQFIKQKLDSAKWFIDAVKQRQQTLMITMQAIMNYQSEYFLTGDERKIKPMILKDIANEIEMDISTISRVANSKYVDTPYGTKLLKEFFSESMKTTSGEEISTIEIKKILEKVVQNENKRKPETDEKLVNILNEKGYKIARRTVAKYREQLNIPVARLRKEI